MAEEVIEMKFSTMIKHPSAFIPVVMSAAAMLLVAGFLAKYGIVRQEDEGTAARIFQLLIVAQLPIVGYHTVRWMPQNVRVALQVLALQIGAALTAVALVFFLEL